MNLAMQLPAMTAVYTVTKNKQQLIMLICEEPTQDADFYNSNTSVHKTCCDRWNWITYWYPQECYYQKGRSENNSWRGRSYPCSSNGCYCSRKSERSFGCFRWYWCIRFAASLLSRANPLNTSCHGISNQREREIAVIDTRQTVRRNSNIVPDLICCTCSIRIWYGSTLSWYWKRNSTENIAFRLSFSCSWRYIYRTTCSDSGGYNLCFGMLWIPWK